MHGTLLDFYLERQSFIHRQSALVKLLVALAIIILTALIPRATWWFYAGVAAALSAALILGRLPLRQIVMRALIIEPFVLGVALMSLLQTNGFAVFLNLAVKSTLCLLTMIILTAVTPFSELLDALRRLRIPGMLITILTLTHRYLFLIFDELVRIRRARASRTFSKRGFHSWSALSEIIAQLFIRTSLRAERVYGAMCSRGWIS